MTPGMVELGDIEETENFKFVSRLQVFVILQYWLGKNVLCHIPRNEKHNEDNLCG